MLELIKSNRVSMAPGSQLLARCCRNRRECLQALQERKSRSDPESVCPTSGGYDFHSFETTSLNISLASRSISYPQVSSLYKLRKCLFIRKPIAMQPHVLPSLIYPNFIYILSRGLMLSAVFNIMHAIVRGLKKLMQRF